MIIAPVMRYYTVIIAFFLIIPLVGCNFSFFTDYKKKHHVKKGDQLKHQYKIITLAPALYELSINFDVKILGHTVHIHNNGLVIGDLFNISVEKIVALSPDYVLCMDFQKRICEKIRSMGIKTQSFTLNSIIDIKKSVLKLGKLFNDQRAAKQLIHTFEKEKSSTPNCPKSLNILLVVGRNPHSLSNLVVAGPKTFLGEMINMLGLNNVIKQSFVPYPKISLETLKNSLINIIIDFTPWDDNPWKDIFEHNSSIRVIRLKERYWTIPSLKTPKRARELYRRICNK